MNQGYIKLWRKALTNGWLRKHKLWVFWSYCLLKATHERHKAIIGNQEIMLEPGQFIFGRKVASTETGLSESEIRTCLAFLKKAQNVTIKTTNKFSIITIVNWNTYQGRKNENDQQKDQVATSKRPHTRMEECKNENISFEILTLRKRYSDQNLIDQVFKAIASTRKSNKVADSVLFNQLQKWERYPVEQVETGIRIYLEKDCGSQGKDEKYLLGIIKNQKAEEPRQESTTGSSLLDSYYARNSH